MLIINLPGNATVCPHFSFTILTSVSLFISSGSYQTLDEPSRLSRYFLKMSEPKPAKSNRSISKIPVRKIEVYEVCQTASDPCEKIVSEIISDSSENNNKITVSESLNENIKIATSKVSFTGIHSVSEDLTSEVETPKSPSKSGKGDLITRRETYTVVSTNGKLNETEVIAEGGDGQLQTLPEIKTETVQSCEIITIKKPESIDPTSARISCVPFNVFNENESSRQTVEIYPKVLLFIPSVETPNIFVSDFTIVNNSYPSLMYKICGNKSAANNLIIHPSLGLIRHHDEIRINIRTSERIGSLGGYCKMLAVNDVLEIRFVESIGCLNASQFFNYWKLAEINCPELIRVERIRNIEVLEPRNMSILEALDKGPDRDFIEKYLKDEYNNKIIPRMIENRKSMTKKQNLVKMKERLNHNLNKVNHINTVTSVLLLVSWLFLLHLFVMPAFFQYPTPNPPSTVTEEPETILGYLKSYFNYFNFSWIFGSSSSEDHASGTKPKSFFDFSWYF